MILAIDGGPNRQRSERSLRIWKFHICTESEQRSPYNNNETMNLFREETTYYETKN